MIFYETLKHAINEFTQALQGICIAVGGWIIASMQSVSWLLQGFTQAEIEIYDAYVSLGIKVVTLLTGIILLFYNLNKIRNQQSGAQGNGDNESGRGSEITPQSNGDNESGRGSKLEPEQ